MPITLRQFADVLTSMVNAVTTKAKAPVDTTVGSAVRAILEASALQDSYLLGQVLAVQNIQRAATATGLDLDSFFADFAFTRLPATQALGQVTFTRLSPNASAPTIAVGTLVQAPLGSIQFTVIADATQTGYNSALSAYVMPANTATVTATVQAVVAGTTSNVLAGAISQIASSVPGVDQVTNGLAFSSAINAESDTAARIRFAAYIVGQSKSTSAALDAAIAGTKQGLNWIKLENLNPDSSTHLGWFSVIAQDGTGTLTTAETAAITAALNTTRAFTVGYTLATPPNVATTIVMTAVLPAAVTTPDAIAAKAAGAAAITAYVGALSIGQNVEWLRCASVAIDAMVAYLAPLGYATAGVSVNGVTVNGVAGDLTIATTSIAHLASVTVS